MNRQLNGAKIGALIGAVGGLLFLVLNAGVVGPDWPPYVIGGAIAVFLAVVWLILRVPADLSGYRPDARQMQAFWIVVALEVVAIIGGTQLAIRVFERPDLSLPWVATVLGVHWLAFHLVFQEPVFVYLGWFTLALGLTGLVIGLTEAGPSGSTTVISGLFVGLVMLGCVGIDAIRRRRALLRTASPQPRGRNRSGSPGRRPGEST